MKHSNIIRWRHLSKIVPFSRATQWRMEKAGLFPKKIIVTKRTVGWDRQEIEDFLSGYLLTKDEN